jgi:hypothetical protein
MCGSGHRSALHLKALIIKMQMMSAYVWRLAKHRGNLLQLKFYRTLPMCCRRNLRHPTGTPCTVCVNCQFDRGTWVFSYLPKGLLAAMTVVRSKQSFWFRIGLSVVNRLVVRTPLLVGCKCGSCCTKAKRRSVGRGPINNRGAEVRCFFY